jgi:hypothetical protein
MADDMPEVPPGTGTSDNPTLRSVNDLGGNGVIIRMRAGVYALYGHLVPGSVRVSGATRSRPASGSACSATPATRRHRTCTSV